VARTPVIPEAMSRTHVRFRFMGEFPDHVETQGEQAAKKVIFQNVANVMQSEDMKEGVQSFIERRKAVFKGK
jgi:hypothetical protein